MKKTIIWIVLVILIAIASYYLFKQIGQINKVKQGESQVTSEAAPESKDQPKAQAISISLEPAAAKIFESSSGESVTYITEKNLNTAAQEYKKYFNEQKIEIEEEITRDTTRYFVISSNGLRYSVSLSGNSLLERTAVSINHIKE